MDRKIFTDLRAGNFQASLITNIETQIRQFAVHIVNADFQEVENNEAFIS